MIDELVTRLETDGIVELPDLFSAEQLQGMQRAFTAQLKSLRWNSVDGYERTERFRHMVEDVLALDQGFVDAALHPTVKEILNSYLGSTYELVEAKGWKSLPTRRDFHGWHGDEWYDQDATDEIPREVKLAIYLTDVKSGEFHYIKGSHQKNAPCYYGNGEMDDVSNSQLVKVFGPAGTAILFDTSGQHRQGVPILEERWAVFLNYHDPSVRLQPGDIESYRYHPLLLNAAFLGELSEEDRRILGFGNKTNYQPEFEQPNPQPIFHAACRMAHGANLTLGNVFSRIKAKLVRG